ncbi:proteasome component PRE3 [Verticillium alfalfae VaMs.102]|uniref:proteasome endopeptidase complex n=1 Tax=Verticillium alfalfae (strain VaMs.102 / ATCC MYA-4576 / FGSC 10136) TaxID=526221 RepID=C9SAQ2_VERA1|nr:proteasome component PRE3 [Verticillium alfalfae VaMs.102]EEY16341.1 proteasome component PRE3 [Verticillium alfalfae VaMs.102]
MDFTTTGSLNEDGIHVDMDRLKKGEVNLGTSMYDPPRPRPALNNSDISSQHGSHIQGRRHSRYAEHSHGKAATAIYVCGTTRDLRADSTPPHAGADSRTTTGSYIANRVTDKLTRVHDTIWCCRSVSSADTQAVADIVQYQLGMYPMRNRKPPMTQTAASIFQEICYSNKDRLSAGLIIAGWDERHGGQVYSIPLGGSLHKQSYAIGGSGSTYIYGYCDANWQESMEEKEAVKIRQGRAARGDQVGWRLWRCHSATAMLAPPVTRHPVRPGLTGEAGLSVDLRAEEGGHAMPQPAGGSVVPGSSSERVHEEYPDVSGPCVRLMPPKKRKKTKNRDGVRFDGMECASWQLEHGDAVKIVRLLERQ